jgi:alpha-beta hydrolase superfamily lysophospholipase
MSSHALCTLPVLVIHGEVDPVGENLVGTRRLVARYRALGMSRTIRGGVE